MVLFPALLIRAVVAMDRVETADVSQRRVAEGVTITPLRLEAGKGTFLMNFKAGSRCPAHNHPGGEEIYVIAGKGRLDSLPIKAGDFIYTPPGESHALYAETDVTIHVVLPEPVVVLE
jgi:quercetin dioxygenase-like cupin family protein